MVKVVVLGASATATLVFLVFVGCGATNADVAEKQRNYDRCRLQAELAREDGADPEEPGQRLCEDRERDLRETTRSRDRRQAVARGLSAVGGQTPSSAEPSTTSSPRKECSSDFGCGPGFRCVKPNYSSLGTCMRLVDGYGVNQFSTPRSNSTGPKMPAATDCRFDTDCPPTFRCDQRSGACVRN